MPEFPWQVAINGEVVALFKHLDTAYAFAEDIGGEVVNDA